MQSDVEGCTLWRREKNLFWQDQGRQSINGRRDKPDEKGYQPMKLDHLLRDGQVGYFYLNNLGLFTAWRYGMHEARDQLLCRPRR